MKTTNTAVQSDEEVAALASGTIQLIATYSFKNPFSINGPFGTLHVILTDEPSGKSAIGTVFIRTLFGTGTTTNMQYNGTTNFSGKNNPATVNALGKGTFTPWEKPPQPITAKMHFTLDAGFQTGLLTVEGFFTDYTLTIVTGDEE